MLLSLCVCVCVCGDVAVWRACDGGAGLICAIEFTLAINQHCRTSLAVTVSLLLNRVVGEMEVCLGHVFFAA